MENGYILASLTRKCAELAQEVREAERRIVQLRADIDAVQRTMRLFDSTAAQPQVPHADATPRNGGFSRAVLGVLRDASAPLTARDIAARIAADRGVDVSKPAAMQAYIGRVRSALDRKRDGVVREQREGVIFWRVAGAA